jgi:hypothetical protein
LTDFLLWYLQGIGNGIPLGAVVTTPEIAKVLTCRSYFNTFGGNPVCTAAGLAVLRVIEKEKLQENAHVVGSYLKDRLTVLKNKYESKLSSFSFCVPRHLNLCISNTIHHIFLYYIDIMQLLGTLGEEDSCKELNLSLIAKRKPPQRLKFCM